MPEGGLIDERFRGMDTGQVYKILKQEKDEQEQEQEQDGQQGQGSGKSGSEGKPLDEHMWEQAKERTKEEEQAIDEAIDRAVRQGEQLAGKMGGKTARELGALPEPEVNWREVLRDFVQSVTAGRDASTWRRPSRRWLCHDMYMPSSISESVGSIVIAVDTSGSINTATISAMLAEVVSLTETYPPEKIHLLYWDTAVAGAEVYEAGHYDSLLASTRPKGGGGTDPTCLPTYLKDNNITAECVIVLSDGYVCNWPTFDSPQLWVMTTDMVAPEGITVKISV
jgi:predicted metal-dependent peptidase